VDLEMRFTGVRPGEKLVEELFNQEKVHRTGVHPKIFEADDVQLDLETLGQGLAELRAILATGREDAREEMMSCFMRMLPNFHPSPNGLSCKLHPMQAAESLHLANGQAFDGQALAQSPRAIGTLTIL
jgi:hypothetical protein